MIIIKISELFTKSQTIIIDSLTYELKFNARAILILESEFNIDEIELQEIMKQITLKAQALNEDQASASIRDYMCIPIKILAQLIVATTQNKITFEECIDKMPHQRDKRIELEAKILMSFMEGALTAEQIEKLEVMAEQNQKNVQMQKEVESTGEVGMPSAKHSATRQKKNS